MKINVLKVVEMVISKMIQFKNVNLVIMDVKVVMVLNQHNVNHVIMDFIYIKIHVKLIVQVNIIRMITYVQIVINSVIIVLDQKVINVYHVQQKCISIQKLILVI